MRVSEVLIRRRPMARMEQSSRASFSNGARTFLIVCLNEAGMDAEQSDFVWLKFNGVSGGVLIWNQVTFLDKPAQHLGGSCREPLLS